MEVCKKISLSLSHFLLFDYSLPEDAMTEKHSGVLVSKGTLFTCWQIFMNSLCFASLCCRTRSGLVCVCPHHFRGGESLFVFISGGDFNQMETCWQLVLHILGFATSQNGHNEDAEHFSRCYIWFKALALNQAFIVSKMDDDSLLFRKQLKFTQMSYFLVFYYFFRYHNTHVYAKFPTFILE